MSKRSEEKERTVLSNALLTDLTSSIFEKFYTLNERVEKDGKLLAEILTIQEAKQNDLARIVELQEEVLKSYLNAQRKDILVLRARVSLLEGLVKGRESDFKLEAEKATVSRENPFAQSNPFAQNVEKDS